MRVVDLWFPVRGVAVPADHAYALYAALSGRLPLLHSNPSVGILPINGRLAGARRLYLDSWSRFVLRIPRDLVAESLQLAGSRLDIDGSSVVVGSPRVVPLKPRAVLWSRLVTIKGYVEPSSFLTAISEQLSAMGIRGRASLLPRQSSHPVDGGVGGKGPWVRRTVSVKDRVIVGYAVKISELTAEESIVLQEQGLGGRRRFGCGVFVPLPRAQG